MFKIRALKLCELSMAFHADARSDQNAATFCFSASGKHERSHGYVTS